MKQLTEEDFKKLENPGVDIIKDKIQEQDTLRSIYFTLKDVITKYCDLNPSYYSLLSIWCIGTYIHKNFETYPYIFLNAMKGSGKTRLLKLLAYLSFNGEVLASMKEAVLFRTNSTLAIDEFESIGRKNSDDLRELLNCAYKKGIKVKRMKKKRTAEGEEQVVEEFDVYRPIIMANIWGMENVLSDRCFTLILERSSDVRRTKLVELFNSDKTIVTLKSEISKEIVSLCRVVASAETYTDWNEYVLYNNTSTQTQNNTKQHFFKKLDDSGINGRYLELSLPLLLIAQEIGEDVFDEMVGILKDILEIKMGEDFLENKDISLYEFISQEPPSDQLISIKEMVARFKSFLREEEDSEHPTNEKWMGKALKRLNLIKIQKRMNYGRVVLLNYKKAQEKIKMFK